jgi:S-phase kinase-associated protein 1
MPKVKLQSSDGVQEDVEIDVIQCSVTIKTMLEDLGFEEGGDEVIPLQNVNSTILKKVIQWALHHKVGRRQD